MQSPPVIIARNISLGKIFRKLLSKNVTIFILLSLVMSNLVILPAANAVENSEVPVYRTYVSEISNDSPLVAMGAVERNLRSGDSVTASTYTFYMSREQVRRSKAALDRGTLLCSVLNLPYPFGILCGGPSDLKEALNRAYYQNKRLKMVYHPCFNYCAYYDYYVVN